jgi:hypothetical protein
LFEGELREDCGEDADFHEYITGEGGIGSYRRRGRTSSEESAETGR